MTSIRIPLLLCGAFLLGSGDAFSEASSCSAQLKAQDERCQDLAEKLAEACPSGTNIKETAGCRELSSRIASTCTRKPCGPAPRKGGKRRTKGMGMAKGMGMGMAK